MRDVVAVAQVREGAPVERAEPFPHREQVGQRLARMLEVRQRSSRRARRPPQRAPRGAPARTCAARSRRRSARAPGRCPRSSRPGRAAARSTTAPPACPPSCETPTSNETRVRVVGFSKISAIDRPSRRPAYVAGTSLHVGGQIEQLAELLGAQIVDARGSRVSTARSLSATSTTDPTGIAVAVDEEPRWSGEPASTSAELGGESMTEAIHDRCHHRLGLVSRQRSVGRAKIDREREALRAGQQRRTVEDVEEHATAEQVARGFLERRLHAPRRRPRRPRRTPGRAGPAGTAARRARPPTMWKPSSGRRARPLPPRPGLRPRGVAPRADAPRRRRRPACRPPARWPNAPGGTGAPRHRRASRMHAELRHQRARTRRWRRRRRTHVRSHASPRRPRPSARTPRAGARRPGRRRAAKTVPASKMRHLLRAASLIASHRVHEPRQEARAQEPLVRLERVRDGHRIGVATRREVVARSEGHQPHLTQPRSHQGVDRPHPESVGSVALRRPARSPARACRSGRSPGAAPPPR